MSDENAGAAEVVMSPGDVARRLGVSPSGLRRLAGVYGAVFGELPKDSSGTSRLWPTEAVGRLEQARALMAAGQARSIRDALLAVEGGAVPRLEPALQDGRVAEALGIVAARLEALEESNRRLEREVTAFRAGRALPSQMLRLGDGDAPETISAGTAAAEDQGSDRRAEDGLLVRVARRLERLLGRGKDD